jgi:2-polyprenyl-3-methyl-5-hydroxy-6-metoxy-1,4-benzoquinol methylase
VYFTQTRRDLIELVPGTGNRVLEIGCGAGNTGEALKRMGKAVEVVGIEQDPEAARWAADKLDHVWQMSIEENTLPLPQEYFDCIVAGDVLEHLQDPWGVVDRLRPCLKHGGHFIASVPNIRNWRILKSLVLAGRWQYTPSGILDRTHLRFFTKHSLAALFERTYFRVERIVPRFAFWPGSKAQVLNRLTLGLFEEFLTSQYIIVVTRV